jgi:Spy/CpxP family protein refolding chaperone
MALQGRWLPIQALSKDTGCTLISPEPERDILAKRGFYEGKRKERQPRRGPSMDRNSISKQIAVAAGFLALTFAPGIGRAQSSPQPPAQDQSQATPTAPAQVEGRMHGAMKGLDLTDGQKAAMKKIHEARKAQADAVNKDESLTADQKEAKIHQLRRGARMQMVKLLTPEQRQQMKANVRALRASRKEQQQQQQPPQTQPQG